MSDEVPAPAPGKPSLKQRLSELFAEYGRVAIITYFTLSILTIIGFSIAIWVGVEPSTSSGVFGVIFAGWALAKATLPVRIIITLFLTPLIELIVSRRRRAAAAAEPPDDPSVPAETP
jgi:hypothetical protein